MQITGYHIGQGVIATSDSKLHTEPPWLNFLLDGEGIKALYHLDYSVANLLVLLKFTEKQLRQLYNESKRYKIINNVTNRQKTVIADSAEEACQRLGWPISDCLVEELSKVKSGTLQTQGYKFRYIPNKFFSIAYGSQFTVFSDMSQYMDSWSLDDGYNESPSDLALRKAYIALEVANEVYRALTKLGLHPKSLTSPIAVFEKEVLSKMDLPTIEDMPEEAAEYAYNCTRGPWVEAFQKGHFVADDFDIRSAYPFQLSQLADLRYGSFRKSKKYEPDTYYGYCKGMVDITADFSPVIYSKTEEQNFTPKGRWETYLTKAEIDFIRQYRIGTFVIYDGWFWYPDKIVKPLEGLMRWLYEKKEGASGLEKKIIKRIASGTWGKLLEVKQDNELGNYVNTPWGVEVESRTRLEVARFVLDNGLEERLLSIAVDGVLVSTEVEHAI